jgi:hypothetical protein
MSTNDEGHHEDRRFWTGQNIFVAVAGAGLFVVFEHPFWGSLFMLVGVSALLYSIKKRTTILSAPTVLWAICLLGTWTLIGYDFYDRHHPGFGYDPNRAWDDNKPLQRVFDQTFTNQTVILDGRHFFNPVFDNVTLVYQGTGGIGIDHPRWILHDGQLTSRLTTKNKIVADTIVIYTMLERAHGCNVDVSHGGPQTVLDSGENPVK